MALWAATNISCWFLRPIHDVEHAPRRLLLALSLRGRDRAFDLLLDEEGGLPTTTS